MTDHESKRGRKPGCIRFFPLASNAAFNRGRWVSPNYSMLVEVEGNRDFSEVTILYADGRRFVVTGENLKGLADAAESFTLKEVRQLDPAHAAVSDGTDYAVTGLEIRVEGEA